MDMNLMGVTGVGAITVICILIGFIVKATVLENKWIPCICGAFGCLLGLLWFFMGYPGFTATDPFTAAAIGIVSGLAATGANQVVKQLSKGE